MAIALHTERARKFVRLKEAVDKKRNDVAWTGGRITHGGLVMTVELVMIALS